MIIKNFEKLATTELRRNALSIVEAGYEAIRTADVVKNKIRLENSILTIGDKEFNLDSYSDLYVFGAGKGSFAVAAELEKILGERIKYGLVVDVQAGFLRKIKAVVGTHPDPSEANLAATREIMQKIQEVPDSSLILFIVCGGGSALLTAPFGISYQTKAKIIDSLMEADADIHELNIVRKHLSEVKGGRLAKLAYPATVVSLIFSDVPGNDISTIASGPLVLDQSTSEEAEAILKRSGVWEKLSLEALEFSETPKEEKYFEKVTNIILQDPTSVTSAMKKKATELGWKSRVFSTNLVGNAEEAGKKLLSAAKKGEALIASGETTVKVVEDGVGGRNQHLILSNLKNIKSGQVIIAAASDGHDHSESAGALGDETSYRRAEKMRLKPEEFLARADSFEFFQKMGDSLDTGLLESNVADFFLVLTNPSD